MFSKFGFYKYSWFTIGTYPVPTVQMFNSFNQCSYFIYIYTRYIRSHLAVKFCEVEQVPDSMQLSEFTHSLSCCVLSVKSESIQQRCHAPRFVPRKISHCGRGVVNSWRKSCFLQFQPHTHIHTSTDLHASTYSTSPSEWPLPPLSFCQGHLLHSCVANIPSAVAVKGALAVSLTSQCDQSGAMSGARFPK